MSTVMDEPTGSNATMAAEDAGSESGNEKQGDRSMEEGAVDNPKASSSPPPATSDNLLTTNKQARVTCILCGRIAEPDQLICPVLQTGVHVRCLQTWLLAEGLWPLPQGAEFRTIRSVRGRFAIAISRYGVFHHDCTCAQREEGVSRERLAAGVS